MRKAFKLPSDNKKKKDNDKPANKKLQIEIHDITSQISFYVIKTRLEKAQKNVFGNFLYLVDNNSHYEIAIEFDFSDSTGINCHELQNIKILKEIIDPYTSCKDYVKSDATEYNLKCKIAEMHYLVGFFINCKIKFDVKFPSIETQLNVIEKDELSQEINDKKKNFTLQSYFKSQDVAFILKETDISKLSQFLSVNKQIVNEKDKVDKEQASPNTTINILNTQQTYEDFIEYLKKNSINYFIDMEFYPNYLKEMLIPIIPTLTFYENISMIPLSEVKNYIRIAVHWRPINIFITSSPVSLELTEIFPQDLTFGMKGNTNLFSVLAHLAEYPIMILRLLTEFTNINKYGFHSVKLFLNGVLTDICLDSLVPCFPNNLPIYIYSSSGKSCWSSMLEKALAKVFGSYDKIRTKSYTLLYKLLTGYNLIQIKHTKDDENMDNLFFDLENYYNKHYLISVTRGTENETNKLNKDDYDVLNKIFSKDFTYPLLFVKKINRLKLFIIRNIFIDHGINLFNTNLEIYATYNSIMKDQKSEMSKILEEHNCKTSIFLIDREFFSIFNIYNILPIKNLFDLTARSRFTRVLDKINPEAESFISSHYFEIELKEVQTIEITINLKDEEFLESRYREIKGLKGFDLSLAILTQGRHDYYDIQYAQFFEFTDYLKCEISLTPGIYILIPRTTGVCLRKHKNAKNHILNPYDKNELNREVLYKIFEDIFLLNDTFCKNYLSKEQINIIFNRLQNCSVEKIDDDEFLKLIGKYCYNCPGITMKGFKELMGDIFSKQDELTILESLNNFGYDKNIYPFLHKFYYLKIFSSKEISMKIRSNLKFNFDQVANDIMLKQKAASEKNRYNSDCSPVSIRQNFVYIEGVINNNKKEDKIITLDFSSSTGAYFSGNNSIIRKLVPSGQTVFFIYIVNIAEEEGVEFRRSFVIEVESVKKDFLNLEKLHLSSNEQ